MLKVVRDRPAKCYIIVAGNGKKFNFSPDDASLFMFDSKGDAERAARLITVAVKEVIRQMEIDANGMANRMKKACKDLMDDAE